MARTFLIGTEKSSHSIWYYQRLYDATAYDPESEGGPAIKNLDYAEMQYYGVVDTEGAIVIPDENRMVRLPGMKHMMVFDFVADMFVDVKTTVDLCRLNGTRDIDLAELKNLKIKKAYSSPVSVYKNYLDKGFY